MLTTHSATCSSGVKNHEPFRLNADRLPSEAEATNSFRASDEFIIGRTLTFRRRIKSRLPFAGIIRRLSYSTRFQDKG